MAEIVLKTDNATNKENNQMPVELRGKIITKGYRQGKALRYQHDSSKDTSHPNYTSAALRIHELRKDARHRNVDVWIELTEYDGVYFVKVYNRIK